jgi:hypothetical protein
MWFAIFAAFILVTVTFGHAPHRQSSDGSSHRQPAAPELTAQVEPGSTPRADGTPVTYKRD